MTTRDHTISICPLPGMGHCVRERCNFWDEAKEECTADDYEACDPAGSGPNWDLEGRCLITFYEDYD